MSGRYSGLAMLLAFAGLPCAASALAAQRGTLAPQGRPATPEERRALERENAWYRSNAGRIEAAARQFQVQAAVIRRSLRRALEASPGLGDAELIRLVEILASDAAQLRTIFETEADRAAAIADARQRRLAEQTLAQARAAFDEGRFDDARRHMADSSAVSLHLLRSERSRFDAHLLAYRKSIEGQGYLALLASDYEGAAELYLEAARNPDITDELRWVFTVNAAAALNRRGDLLGDNAALRRAIAILRDEALPLASPERRPLERGSTQNAIGVALQLLGEREPGTARLLEARTAYQAALLGRTRERAAPLWAETMVNLGQVLQMLYERQGDRRWLDEAVAAHEATLQVITREGHPYQWARIQMNLGNAYLGLDERTNDEGRALAALRAFEQALSIFGNDTPSDWADANSGVGNALLALGGRRRDAAMLRRAAATFDRSARIYAALGGPLDQGRAFQNKGASLLELSSLDPDPAVLREAEEAYRAALLLRTRDRAPMQWAASQHGLADILLRRGERGRDFVVLSEAVGAYGQALSVWSRENSFSDWAAAVANRGFANFRIGELRGDVALLRATAAELTELRRVLRAAGGQDGGIEIVERTLNLIQGAERRLRND